MAPPLTREQHLDLYYFMQLNRQLEDRLVRLHRQNKIIGGVYSSLGQEGVSVGSAYALESRDWIAPMIRNIGALLVKGFKPRDIFTQHMGKYTSPTKGKDGTSHFGDLQTLHTVSPISMLGDLIPVMAGVAMAGRYLGQKIVAMTWIGDGGSSTGAFHEGLNFAAVQRAPLVLILENNQWAYSTPVSRQVPLKNLADRAKAYGIDSAIVDGNDVLAVYEATKKAVDQCRGGHGPVLIEVKTMRMKGHAQHDPAEYVPKEMVAFWKNEDPIARYERYLTSQKLWDEKKKTEIDAGIERELADEQKFAEESPWPPPELAAQGVYCEGCHAVQADWHRPKEQVMPPASSVEALWKIQDFGAYTKRSGPDAGARSPMPGDAPLDERFANRGGSDRKGGKNGGGAESAADTPANGEVPLRVPFGRGPKDRAFAQEKQSPPEPKYRPRHHKGHKRGGR